MSDNPYFQYGFQRRYPYAWHGNPGGTAVQSRAPRSSLGIFDLLEAGYQDPTFRPFPAFKRTNLHHRSMLSGYPLVRPQGPETLDPNNMAGAMGMFDTLTNAQKIVGTVAVAGAAYWYFFKRGGRGPRKNPSSAKWSVVSGSREVMRFRKKRTAQQHADKLRARGRKARLRRR